LIPSRRDPAEGRAGVPGAARDWQLGLDLEQVDAWIQVTSLQHVLVSEAQAKVTANLQYQIENTGVRSFVVRLPAQAEGVRFKGEQVADFLPREGATNTATRDWEVKLHRRLIGKYTLQVSYSLLLPTQPRKPRSPGSRRRT